MRLIVGLGNPGKKYEKTRHNAGFLTINNLQLTINNFSNWKLNKKLNAEVAVDGVRNLLRLDARQASHSKHRTSEKIGDTKIILLKPQTFMNKSGAAVAATSHFYKIRPQDILVIHDDIDLPLGKIRIKKDGSSGGHQGVQSIIDVLHTQNFARLKIGVGPRLRPKEFDAVKFVLKKFSKTEEKILTEAIKKATEAVAVILTEGTDAAMNKFN